MRTYVACVHNMACRLYQISQEKEKKNNETTLMFVRTPKIYNTQVSQRQHIHTHTHTECVQKEGQKEQNVRQEVNWKEPQKQQQQQQQPPHNAIRMQDVYTELATHGTVAYMQEIGCRVFCNLNFFLPHFTDSLTEPLRIHIHIHTERH